MTTLRLVKSSLPRLLLAGIALHVSNAVFPVNAQTGMCLVIDQGRSGYWASGKLYRIDMHDGSIRTTTGALAENAFCPRFSPDGNRFAFTRNGNHVYICDLDGNVLHDFDARGGFLSWTTGGIWTHPNYKNTGDFYKYDPVTGKQIRKYSFNVPSYTAYVSQNETAIGTFYRENSNETGAILLDDNNKLVHFGPGCSCCPSPNGQMFTNNLHNHQTMKVWNRNRKELYYLRMWEILPYPRNGYSWNAQSFSSNSNKHIIIPCGKKGPHELQQYGSTVPWVYNLESGEAFCFHTNPNADVFWFPYDYYDGKVPGSEETRAAWIKITPERATVSVNESVQFTGTVEDRDGRALSPQPAISWTVSGGGSMSHNTFNAGSSPGGPFTVTATCGAVTTTAQVTVAETVVRVNCGTNGNGFDVDGWERDDGYITGHDPSNDHNWSGTIALSGAGNAAPAEVYKSVYHRDHTYTFPDVADGTYIIRIHFADEHSSTQRNMTYIVNGRAILRDFSITDEAGVNQALIKDIPFTVSSGNGLTLACKGAGGDVFECGLEILKTGDAPAQKVISFVKPVPGSTWHMGDECEIAWEGNPDSLTVLDLKVSVDDGLTWTRINTSSIDPGINGSGTFTWRIGTVETEEGEVSPVGDRVLLKVSDYNNPYEDVVGYITIHNQAATLRCGTQPAGGGSVQLTAGAVRIEAHPQAILSVGIAKPNGTILRYGLCEDTRATIATTQLPRGLYLLVVETGGRKQRLPFVVP